MPAGPSILQMTEIDSLFVRALGYLRRPCSPDRVQHDGYTSQTIDRGGGWTLLLTAGTGGIANFEVEAKIQAFDPECVKKEEEN